MARLGAHANGACPLVKSDVLHYIVDFLDVRDAQRLSQTCRSAREACSRRTGTVEDIKATGLSALDSALHCLRSPSSPPIRLTLSLKKSDDSKQLRTSLAGCGSRLTVLNLTFLSAECGTVWDFLQSDAANSLHILRLAVRSKKSGSGANRESHSYPATIPSAVLLSVAAYSWLETLALENIVFPDWWQHLRANTTSPLLCLQLTTARDMKMWILEIIIPSLFPNLDHLILDVPLTFHSTEPRMPIPLQLKTLDIRRPSAQSSLLRVLARFSCHTVQNLRITAGSSEDVYIFDPAPILLFFSGHSYTSLHYDETTMTLVSSTGFERTFKLGHSVLECFDVPTIFSKISSDLDIHVLKIASQLIWEFEEEANTVLTAVTDLEIILEGNSDEDAKRTLDCPRVGLVEGRVLRLPHLRRLLINGELNPDLRVQGEKLAGYLRSLVIPGVFPLESLTIKCITVIGDRSSIEDIATSIEYRVFA